MDTHIFYENVEMQLEMGHTGIIYQRYPTRMNEALGREREKTAVQHIGRVALTDVCACLILPASIQLIKVTNCLTIG